MLKYKKEIGGMNTMIPIYVNKFTVSENNEFIYYNENFDLIEIEISKNEITDRISIGGTFSDIKLIKDQQ